MLPVQAGEVKRRPLESGIMALGKDGRTLGLEVQLRGKKGSSEILAHYLLSPAEGATYANRATSFVPFERLSAGAKRKVLLTIFDNDVIDAAGWHHTAIFKGETLWTLCQWITGQGSTYKQVLAIPENNVSGTLKKGQHIRIPLNLLSQVMKKPTPKVATKPTVKTTPLPETKVASKTAVVQLKDVSDPVAVKITPEVVSQATPDLKYKRDAQGEFAAYTLKKGETLYSAVVIRFTHYTAHADIVKASEELARRSAIKNLRDIDAGMEVRIPMEMLSAKYQPQGTKTHIAHATPTKEPPSVKKAVIKTHKVSKPLSDIVVILDPGHGGEDHGASYPRSGLYEDEINYDIVMRIKKLLEKDTGAKVYVTLKDKSSGYAFNDRTRFTYDRDEILLTNPVHTNNVDAHFSANLRWMLVNKIYDAERKRGVPARKIIFTSVHTESVMNRSHRGTKIFVPGYKYRRSTKSYKNASYAKYAEGRSHNTYSSTSSERKTDETLSRKFATVVMDELGKHRIKRNNGGNAIRGEIQKSRNTVFVPAVLNYTKVPTKILIETANLQNPTDRQRLADPWWRQEYAKAYVSALKRFYTVSSTKTSVAKAQK